MEGAGAVRWGRHAPFPLAAQGAGTKDNGLVLNTPMKVVLHCYVDADFLDFGDIRILKTLFVIGVGLDL